MNQIRVSIVDRVAALHLACDAKIVAFRWDILAWALVIDIDYRESAEDGSDGIGRAWLVFDDITDISCSLDEARLPNGIFSTYGIVEKKVDADYIDFSLFVLAPRFGSSDKVQSNPNCEIKLRAKDFRAVKSNKVAAFGEFGPNFNERQNLASDQELLDAVLNQRR
jgi:hypothetical protein